MWNKIADFILRNKRYILIVIGVITVFMGYNMKNLHMKYTSALLLNEKDSAYVRFLDFKKAFGEDGSMMVVGFEDKDFVTIDKFNDLLALQDSLKTVNGIKAVLSADELTVKNTEEADGVIVYNTDKGTAVQATDPNGFGGKLTVLVGFDSKGAIQGYRVLESAETPGLGAKAGEWFQKGQKGDIIGMSPEKNNMTVSKDGGEVDAITASTITSRAFLRCVNAAYAALKTEEDAQSGATRQAADNTNEED